MRLPHQIEWRIAAALTWLLAPLFRSPTILRTLNRVDPVRRAVNERDMFINPHVIELIADETECDLQCPYMGSTRCPHAERVRDYCAIDHAEWLRGIAQAARAEGQTGDWIVIGHERIPHVRRP